MSTQIDLGRWDPIQYDEIAAVKGWWPELQLDLDLPVIAADFYLLQLAAEDNPYLTSRLGQYAEVLAQQFAVYLDAAVGGEARHANFQGLKRLKGRSMARRQWREIRLKKGLPVLELLSKRYHTGRWKGGYGGSSWGVITDVLIQFLRGDISPTLFVDLTFALYHNGGTVFNKIGAYWRYDGLKDVLDAHLSENYAFLRAKASPWALNIFDTCLSDEDCDTIQMKGSDQLDFDATDPGMPLTEGDQPMKGEWYIASLTARHAASRGKYVKVVQAKLESTGNNAGTWYCKVRNEAGDEFGIRGINLSRSGGKIVRNYLVAQMAAA